ncbi:MAG: hypothetical protein ACKVP7_06115 [Hyphomicrobiaceae bacterium]
MYRALDPEKIVSQLEQLERRINERFPGAGLARVCTELITVARESHARVERIGRRNWALRISVLVLLLACVVLIGWIGRYIDFSKTNADSVYSVLQGIEATMNIVVLMGVAVLFLIGFEERLKRRRAVAAIHELRSIVHVIDMHQLTKDPGSIVGQGRDTASSPKRSLTPFLLARYLDYCSEMLSLTAKVAALYAQSLPDPVVASAANDLEQMTANLANKIWQKINIVQNMIAALPITSVPAVPRQVDGPKPEAKVDTAPPRRPGG